MEDHDAQGRLLPTANINRIMKRALPESAKIAKDAKQIVQECVSEFISFITSQACEKCKLEKRKTINGEDILYSISTLGLESYAQILKLYLSKYREALKAGGKGDREAEPGEEEGQEELDEPKEQSI